MSRYFFQLRVRFYALGESAATLVPMWLLVHPGPFSVLLLTYYPAAIKLVNSLQKDFYVT
jgi:hypothetical protein